MASLYWVSWPECRSATTRGSRQLNQRTPSMNSQPRALSDLPDGFCGIVARVTGGRELASRLAAMGLTVGTEIVVLQNRGFGPMLARVRDTRIALGRSQAGLVIVYERRTEHPPATPAHGSPG
jgi:ferrous iron transport protein A